MSLISFGIISCNGYTTTSSNLIFLKDDEPYGKSYAEWLGKWWQWHISIPSEFNNLESADMSLVHPREAYSPEKCAWNQDDGNVWYLADGKHLPIEEKTKPEIRECFIPSGKAILVQIYGSGCSYGEGFRSLIELEECVNIGLDSVKLSAKVDGLEVVNSVDKEKILPQPSLFNLTYVKDNLYNIPEGTYGGMANGYFLFIKPLSNGLHTIEFQETYFKSGFEGQPSNENRFSNVKYNLIVG